MFYRWWWVLARDILNKNGLYNNACSLISIEDKEVSWKLSQEYEHDDKCYIKCCSKNTTKIKHWITIP